MEYGGDCWTMETVWVAYTDVSVFLRAEAGPDSPDDPDKSTLHPRQNFPGRPGQVDSAPDSVRMPRTIRTSRLCFRRSLRQRWPESPEASQASQSPRYAILKASLVCFSMALGL